MHKPVVQDCMSQLKEKSPKLYQQLKQRQMNYISVINDLRQQNQKLKILLQQHNNKLFDSSNTFPVHHSLNSSNPFLKHFPIYQGSQKILINYSTSAPRSTSPLNFLSNNQNPKSVLMDQQINIKERQPVDAFQVQNRNKPRQERQDEKFQKKQNLWQAKTNKSIQKDDSVFFQSKKENQNDEGYSQIVHRQSSSKLHYLIGSQSQLSEKVIGEKNTINRTLQYSSSIQVAPSLENMPQNQFKLNCEQIFSKMNRPVISNRVYL